MEKLVLHMKSRSFSAEQLKKLVQKLSQKGKFKNEKELWVDLLKVLVDKLSEGHSDVLLQNIFKLIKSQNYQPLKDDAVSRKEARLTLESLSDLITHIHNGLKGSDASQSDLSRVTAAILPVVIDMKVQLIRKEKSAAAEVIYNKLKSLLGHSPELRIDALLHCKTLLYSKLREPEIFVPIIKCEFSSLKALPNSLSPELYLKYLVLGKFLLFMTPREDLSQTRAQVLGLLRLPSLFSEWISHNQIEWLQYNKLDTKTVLKNIVISTVLQTLYSKKGHALSPKKKKKEAALTPVIINETGSQVENEGASYSPSETNKNISDIPSFEKSRKQKRKICETASEISSQTKKKKKKSKAKSTVSGNSSVEEAQGNGHLNKEMMSDNAESQQVVAEKQSSKEGKDNADEMVININASELLVTEIPKGKHSNMEQSTEVDSVVKTTNMKKKKKKKKKKIASVMGDTREVSESFTEAETLKVEMIKESCDLTSIGETKSLKKTKGISKDSSQAVDVSSIANAVNKEIANHKPLCTVTAKNTSLENEMQESHVISENLLSIEKSKVKKKKKKKQKPLSDPEECLGSQDKIQENISRKGKPFEVNMEDTTENHGSSKTPEGTSIKKKKKLSEEVMGSLPKKRKTDLEKRTVNEKEGSSDTHLSVESTIVGAETKILKKNKKRKMKEKCSNAPDKGEKPKEAAEKSTEKADKVGSEIVLGNSAKVGEDKMKDKQSRRDKTRKREVSKEDMCIGKSVSGMEDTEGLSEYQTEEFARNTESATLKGKKTKKIKVLKDVRNVECEVKLDQASKLKKELMALVKKSKISKKQFLRKMLDVVFGGSEGDDVLKKSILVKLCDKVNANKGIRKSKEVNVSREEKLKETKMKKKGRLELFDKTSFEQSELPKKRKLSLSIKNPRDNPREGERRRRTCSLNFEISDLAPEKFRRNVHKTVTSAVSEPSSSTFDAHSACDKLSITDNLEVGHESKVNVNMSGNGVLAGSEHAKVPTLTESKGNKTGGGSVDKKTLNTDSNRNNDNLKNKENQQVASSDSNILRKDDNKTGSKKCLEIEETRTMDKFIPEDGTSEGQDECSGIEIVFVGNVEKSFDQEDSDSERDEAFGSEGDIVPCDEMNRMFTEDETKAYHQKVLEEGVKWKMHDLLDNNTLSISEGHENNLEEKSMKDSYANKNEDLKHINEDVLHGFDDKLEDSDTNCNDSDIDVILETIVQDTGRESSVAGLKEELKRSRSSISNDDNVVGVSSLILSNGEGREAVGANDESMLINENYICVGKAHTVDLNCQKSPAVKEHCDLGGNNDEVKDAPVTDIKEISCLDAKTTMPANDINPELNGICEEVSTFAKDNQTSTRNLNDLGSVCEESSDSRNHLQAADKRVNSSGHTVLITEDGELDRSKITEVTPEDNEHMVKHSSLTSCSRSPLQNGDKSMSDAINGSDMTNGKESVSSKMLGRSFDLDINMQTVSQQSFKSGSSLGGYVTAFEDLETSQTADSNLLNASPMKCCNEIGINSENEAANSLDNLFNERVNGMESDAYKNSEMKGTDEPLVGRFLVCDESPVSEGASVKKAKAVDESFEVLSNEGDEAYEASSDASEEPLPVSRKRTRSQRKLVQASRISEEVSDSDFSPMRRSLRFRRASESRKKNVSAKMDEKLMNNSNVCLNANSGPESDTDDTSNMCNSTETTVTKQSSKEIDEGSLHNLVSNWKTYDKLEIEDLAIDRAKKSYLSDSQLGRTKLSEKHAVDCIVGKKSSLDGLMKSQTCMGSLSAPEFVPDGENDSDGKSLHALESLASMHKLCEKEKNHTGVVPDETEILLDNFSALETTECFNERFSCIEENILTMNEEEGDEIEVLSSGLDEDEELSYNLSVENSLAASDGCYDMGKGSKNTVRSRRLRKRSLNNNTNGPVVGKKKEDFGDADIPQVKAQCVSEAVLKKEILISPEVSDEECELVSPEEDASRKRLQVPDNIIDTQARLSKGSISPFSMRGSRSGIRSPQKLIPEEQDESSPRRLKLSPLAKESPGQKAAKPAQRSSSSERSTVARHLSIYSPRSVASRKTDTTKITPPKNGDALQYGNISPKKSAFSKLNSKEEKSMTPKRNGNASETDLDGALKISDGTWDKGGQPSLLLRSGSGKGNLESGGQYASILTESGVSLLPKLGESNELIGAEVPSVVRKRTEEKTVVSDSCDKTLSSSETDTSVTNTKSTDDSVSSLPSITMPVRRSSRLSLSKVTLKGRTQSKALSHNQQTELQESSDCELPVSPRKCIETGSQGKARKHVKEENQLSPSRGIPKELVDISSPTTPQKSQIKNQGSSSPLSVVKPSVVAKASPSQGRPKKIGDSSPFTPRKTRMQGTALPSTPRNTRRQGLVSPVHGTKKSRLSLSCKRISSPSVSPQKCLQDEEATDVSEVDSGRLVSRSASSSPHGMSRSNVSRNVVVKCASLQVGPNPSSAELDSGKSTPCSDYSRALPSVLQSKRVSTRGKAAVVCPSSSPKKLVKNLRALSPASPTNKTDQRSSTIKGKSSASLQESVEDNANVSTRRLRHREVTYATKR